MRKRASTKGKRIGETAQGRGAKAVSANDRPSGQGTRQGAWGWDYVAATVAQITIALSMFFILSSFIGARFGTTEKESEVSKKIDSLLIEFKADIRNINFLNYQKQK